MTASTIAPRRSARLQEHRHNSRLTAATWSNTEKPSLLGVVDSVSNVKGTIEIIDNEPCDCMLIYLNPSETKDRFYILQLIKTVDKSYVNYSRWGNTGTEGRAFQQAKNNYKDAVKYFEKKFKEKTGLEWENRSDGPVGGKYQFIQQNFVEKQRGFTSAKWQYWVNDGIDGKETGWYDYDKSGSRNIEQLFQENLNNSHLMNRLVDSGCWTYHVDLAKMIQTNIKHPNRTSRHIRRYTREETDRDYPPTNMSSLLNRSYSPPQELDDYFLLTRYAGLTPFQALGINVGTGLTVVFGRLLVSIVELSKMSVGLLLDIASEVISILQHVKLMDALSNLSLGVLLAFAYCIRFFISILKHVNELIGHTHCDAH